MNNHIFFATPMSGLRHHEYQRHRDRSLEIVDGLRQNYGASVYFAGEKITSTADFDDPKTALLTDWAHLTSSEIFVLYYPDRVQSSVLVELGAALALRKPSLCLVKNADDLPFLIRSASEIKDHKNLPIVEILQHTDFAQLQEIIGGAQLLKHLLKTGGKVTL